MVTLLLGKTIDEEPPNHLPHSRHCSSASDINAIGTMPGLLHILCSDTVRWLDYLDYNPILRHQRINNQLGSLPTDVRGTLQTQAASSEHQTSGSKQFTTATAIWTTNTSRAIQSVQSKENFTYTYYMARLTNSSVSTLDANSTTGTYFLNGTWTISAITSTITINTDVNGTITRVHRDQDITPTKAYGELSINGTQFTLSITGQQQLSGSVYRSVTRSWFNPFKMSDDATSAITHTDVKIVAKCYGAMPGWGNYDQSMDFNENYRVDIADISTVAANM